VSDQALFAIDQAVSHPSMQSKLDEFIASLNTEDNDISDRDLIPINFKPTSRLQTGMYTPSPSGSRVNSRSGSRRASVSSSRRASVSSSRRNSIITSSPTRKLSLNTVIPNSVAATTTYQVPQDIDQSSKLFATASASIFRKTPYTSASVTPALARTPDEYERHDYFYEDDDDDEEEDDFLASEQNNGSDFLFDHQYSLTDQLMTEPVDSLVEWDPLGALNKLKEHSESMVLRQSLQEALVKTAQQQQQQQEQEEMVTASDDNKLLGMIQAEEEEEKQPIFSDTPPLPSIKKIKRPTAFKSSWDDEEYELPSALASGESTPRTPIARRLSSSDLTKLLALEKERFRQQRASLKMAEPQAAVASMLEAELDLSRGLLFQRRHHYLGDSDDSDDEMQATLSIASNEPRELLASGESDDDNDENQARVSPDQYAAYYDEHVILEAQKRLRALVTGEKLEEIDSMPLPFPNRTRETVKNSRSNTAFAGPLYNYGETRSADPQPFSLMYNSRSYHANFGFDENRKLQIYRSDLLPTDEWMEDMKTLNPEIIVRKNNPIEKQKLAKEKEEVEQKFKEERVKEQRLNILAASKENVSATVTNAEIPEAIDTSKGAITQESTSSASANLSNDTMNDLTNNQMFSTTANAAKKQNETTLIPDAKNKQQLIDAPATNTKKSNIEIASTAILDKPNDSFTSRRGASLIATTNKIDLEEIQDIVEPTTDEMKQKTVQNTFDSGPNLVIDSASLVFETAATGKAATKDCIVETKVSEQNSSTYALSATKDAEETGFDTAKPISLHSTLISFTTSEPAASITPTLERFSAVTAKTTTPLESSVTTVADSVTLPVETSKSITEKSSNSFSALTSHKSESSSSSMTVTRTTSSSSSTTTKTNSSSSKTSTKAKRRNSRRKSAKSSQNQAANK
jgi:hypothetical protein